MEQVPAGSPRDSTPGDHGKRKRSDGEDDGGGGRRRGGKHSKPLQHGSHAHKKRNMGRNEHFRGQLDRRGRNAEQQEKNKQKAQGADNEASALPAAFSTHEVEAEERRPKRKVAVMIGYSGTGYKGMQIDNKQKTIEGDLFNAFVKAGAISKANADDPKKSSLVRCARTDKGVHAAGNVISLKLIIEDDDIVNKINSQLSDQIRVWGIQRTTGSFSCYQACDSRWYEYLIPTHTFLPPHPSSHLGKKLVEYAEKEGDVEQYNERQAEVADFWPNVEEKHIKPILNSLDDSIRLLVQEALYNVDAIGETNSEPALKDGGSVKSYLAGEPAENQQGQLENQETPQQTYQSFQAAAAGGGEDTIGNGVSDTTDNEVRETVDNIEKQQPDTVLNDETDGSVPLPEGVVNKPALEAAIKALKGAYLNAKKAYRISPKRQARVQAALNQYVGTHKFHNYTIQKKFTDRSAQRFIKSFKVADDPIIINDTEWLSLKVHGQSFMMHQIRKMVGMATLTVRCGTNPEIFKRTFENNIIRIPKAPGLGLLLERPVFDSYNDKQAKPAGRDPIDFSKYDEEIEDFKEREIYQRIFREEAQGNQFNSFFTHLDNYKDPIFMYLTSGGIEATKKVDHKSMQTKWEDSEDENVSDGEG